MAVKGYKLTFCVVLFSCFVLSCLAQNQDFSAQFAPGTDATLKCFDPSVGQQNSDDFFIELSYGSSIDNLTPILRWMFSNQAINNLEGSSIEQFSISTDGSLTISNVMQKNSGLYRCESNSFNIGEDTLWTTSLAVSDSEVTSTSSGSSQGSSSSRASGSSQGSSSSRASGSSQGSSSSRKTDSQHSSSSQTTPYRLFIAVALFSNLLLFYIG